MSDPVVQQVKEHLLNFVLYLEEEMNMRDSNFTLGQTKNVCLGFPYLPYFFALKNAYPNIFMVILA